MLATLLCNESIDTSSNQNQLPTPSSKSVSASESSSSRPSSSSSSFRMVPQAVLDGTMNIHDNDLSYYADIVCLKTPYKNNTRSVSLSSSHSSSGSDDTNLLSVLSEGPEGDVEGEGAHEEAKFDESDYEAQTFTSSPPPSPRHLADPAIDSIDIDIDVDPFETDADLDNEIEITTAPPRQQAHRSRSRSHPSNNQKRKSVRFDKITIREYDLTVGDNPACTAGAPISLSWSYNAHTIETFPVDVYESYRDGSRCEPEDLKLNERVRHRLLLEWDVPLSKIKRAEKRCRLVQDQRRQTIECLIQQEEEEMRMKVMELQFQDCNLRSSSSSSSSSSGSSSSSSKKVQPRFFKNIKETFSRIFMPSSSSSSSKSSWS